MSKDDERLRRGKRVASRSLDGQAVLVLAATGEVVVLNETGTLLWEQLASPRSRSELARELAHEFDVDDARAAADVAVFVDALLAKGAVVVDGLDASAPSPGDEAPS